MEQLIGDQWRQWALIKIFFAAILLYFIIRLLQRSFKILHHKYGPQIPYQKFFPALEMLIWASFIYWSLKEAISEPLYYSIFFIAISLILFIWIGWYFGRDYIAGIIWRSQDIYEEGQQLFINEINGIMTKLGYLNIELEKKDGTVIKIPYSKIAGNIHYNKSDNKLVVTHTFTIEVTHNEMLENSLQKLRSILVNSPWHISYLEPHIKKVNESGSKTMLEIVVHSFGEDGIQKLRLLINKQLAVDM